MKKILLSMMLISAFAIVKAQTCGTGDVRRWTGTGLPGDMGSSPAPITINGSSSDWENWITGLFAYSSLPADGYEPNPYGNPLAQANVQFDGLRNATGADYDRDVPGQNHRDLRYFAFTYDQKNVYFIFRRPKNNTAQVSLYYFMDINVDGYMAQGEPVIHVTFNNSGASIEMGYYHPVDFNATAPGSYDPVKGNLMSTPAGVTRAKNSPNTSEWDPASADGWSLPGDFISFGNGVTLPALATGELFNAETLVDSYTGGVTESGYGVEFAIPWQYLRTYNAQGPLGSPLTFTDVFTWHVSLVSGQSGISRAEDNAGGCCSGLAVSGNPNVSGSPSVTQSSLYDFRYKVAYQELRNINSTISTTQIIIKNPKDGFGAHFDPTNVAGWTITGYKDADCNNVADGSGITFNFNASASYPIIPAAPDRVYVFNPSVPTDTKMSVIGNGTVCFFADISTVTGGWPPLKVAYFGFRSSAEFDLNTEFCNPTGNSSGIGEIEVLPVKLTYFNAKRNGKDVNLTWETSIEENSMGFDIQRLIGGGGWQTIAFVPTQAVNGSSSTPLTYQFNDLNNTTKGVTQYRLKQIDKDNRSAYSVIRSVRGEGQKMKTIIYPNPSGDGKVNILFEDANGIRDISLMDVSGRMIKQMKGVTNNNIVIDNLSAGFYTVRIVNTETGEQAVEKFVVNKR